ncbi:transcription/translation regulatory transformer protein RfaH [Burkholderia ubonensis]|uniref:transcription/translation regulatory transformer protein RfaH n=1 Tax=Burkholderia ubonensis TaxID=101571 RepID=UPI0009B4D3F3|nr:transcription/translation regulatory transformer protein RfaH [Burkholderia ubonensis]
MDWYVVHTKPRQERLALHNLTQQGFECFLPFITLEKMKHGKKCRVTEPLFSRYLFIHLDSGPQGRSWSPIRSTKGVSRIVAFGATAAKVDEKVVSMLCSQPEALTCSEKLFTQGERLRIGGGALAELDAIYQMEDGEQRALVLIQLLGRPVRVSVPVAELTKV